MNASHDAPWVDGLTIGQMLAKTAARCGDRDALVFTSLDYRRTYREFKADVDAAARGLAEAGLAQRLMVDFSHSNSSKNAQKQMDVGADITRQLSHGEERIFGIMVESHLKSGRQDLVPGKPLVYGQSITDGCISWEDTKKLLDTLADGVRRRRLKRTETDQ